MASLFQWEWIIIELVVLGIAVAELISVRRSLRRDREKAAAEARDRAPPELNRS
jgi:hypothetical protein